MSQIGIAGFEIEHPQVNFSSFEIQVILYKVLFQNTQDLR